MGLEKPESVYIQLKQPKRRRYQTITSYGVDFDELAARIKATVGVDTASKPKPARRKNAAA